MRYSIKALFGTTVVFAGYASLYSCQTLWQASIASVVISASLLWSIYSVGVVRQITDGKLRFSFRLPSLAFALGCAMFFAGMFLFFPAAERIALDYFYIAEQNGYQAHFEEHEMMTLEMGVATVLIGLPVVVVAGICATFPSQKFGLHGLTRYTMGFLLALTPLVFGMLMIVSYALTAWQLQGGR